MLLSTFYWKITFLAEYDGELELVQKVLMMKGKRRQWLDWAII